MKKKIYTLLVIIIAMQLQTTPVFASNETQAKINESRIFLDGQEIWNVGFNVSNTNYFKLRDIAENLSESTSRFQVNWNSEKSLIEIITGESYMPSASDKQYWYYAGKKYNGTLKNTNILVDGKIHSLPAFNINGSNYFKLRDLGELVDFDIKWDKHTSQILLSSRILENT